MDEEIQSKIDKMTKGLSTFLFAVFIAVIVLGGLILWLTSIDVIK